MTCPSCGVAIETTQERWQARQRALGRCIACGAVADGGHQRCRVCRRKIAEAAWRRKVRQACAAGMECSRCGRVR